MSDSISTAHVSDEADALLNTVSNSVLAKVNKELSNHSGPERLTADQAIGIATLILQIFKNCQEARAAGSGAAAKRIKDLAERNRMIDRVALRLQIRNSDMPEFSRRDLIKALYDTAKETTEEDLTKLYTIAR